MPVIEPSTFRPVWWLPGGHAQTAWSALFRRTPRLEWRRERIELGDGDFLDADWSCVGSRRLVVISHGLEGNSRQTYVAGMARAVNRRGWDALAWNFRGCSGEPNRLPRAYHSGATDDLAAVVDHGASRGYGRIAVVGFSLGANLTLKYLGEIEAEPGHIVGGAAISVPCDLRAAAEYMARPACRPYMRRFLYEMGEKMVRLRGRFGERISDANCRRMTTFKEFDDAFTAPLHGFRDAHDYWVRCSSGGFLERIRVPTLILNALDDPFLPPACFPFEQARSSEFVFLEATRGGGHVAFVGHGTPSGECWSEFRAGEFLSRV